MKMEAVYSYEKLVFVHMFIWYQYSEDHHLNDKSSYKNVTWQFLRSLDLMISPVIKSTMKSNCRRFMYVNWTIVHWAQYKLYHG
jgi:hypothetical protein